MANDEVDEIDDIDDLFDVVKLNVTDVKNSVSDKLEDIDVGDAV